jgi:hypothetical protein
MRNQTIIFSLIAVLLLTQHTAFAQWGGIFGRGLGGAAFGRSMAGSGFGQAGLGRSMSGLGRSTGGGFGKSMSASGVPHNLLQSAECRNHRAASAHDHYPLVLGVRERRRLQHANRSPCVPHRALPVGPWAQGDQARQFDLHHSRIGLLPRVHKVPLSSLLVPIERQVPPDGEHLLGTQIIIG